MGKIGIIGFGYVGQAVYANAYKPDQILVNDPYKAITNNTSIDEIKKQCEFIFVCVSTPQKEDGSVDPSNVLNVLNKLIDYNGLIIVKSTIPSKHIPKRSKLVVNPEFLNANTSLKDFRDQKYIVLGGEINDTLEVRKLYKRSFNLTSIIKYEHCSIKEACDFKYIRNIKNAYNVMFWEYVEDMTGNSRKMAQMMKNFPVNENNIVGLGGQRGFDGACLPKDVSAAEQEKPHLLTRFLINFNRVLRNHY